MQKELDFRFLEVIRDRKSIKLYIHWQSESIGVYFKDEYIINVLVYRQKHTYFFLTWKKREF